LILFLQFCPSTRERERERERERGITYRRWLLGQGINYVSYQCTTILNHWIIVYIIPHDFNARCHTQFWSPLYASLSIRPFSILYSNLKVCDNRNIWRLTWLSELLYVRWLGKIWGIVKRARVREAKFAIHKIKRSKLQVCKC
jgi:hypothetical protein